MFIVAIPHESESGIRRAEAFASVVKTTRPGWTTFLILPENVPHDRSCSVVVRRPSAPQPAGSPSSYDGAWFDSLFRQFAIDAVWAGDSWVAQHVRYSGEGGYTDSCFPTVLADFGKGPDGSGSPWTAAQRAAGMSAADVCTFADVPGMEASVLQAERWLNPLEMGRVTRKCHVVDGGGGRSFPDLIEVATRFDLESEPDVLEFAGKVAGAHLDAPFSSFYRAVKGKRVGRRVPFSNQSLPMTKALRLVRALGFGVVWAGGAQRIVRGK